jgi:hypothetical protein
MRTNAALLSGNDRRTRRITPASLHSQGTG